MTVELQIAVPVRPSLPAPIVVELDCAYAVPASNATEAVVAIAAVIVRFRVI
ncbi:MAG TPA: hypothetical protein VK690_04950 [Stellaceae bacterium]|nr:hypothetical protein [Stellaceae bacterium]